MDVIENIAGAFIGILILMGIIAGISSGGSKTTQSSTIVSGNTWAGRQYNKQIEEQNRRNRQSNIQTFQIRVENPPSYRSHVGTPRENYKELWDECETIIDALDDAGIDHDELSYPMDYYELRDMRDELEYTAEENDVEW